MFLDASSYTLGKVYLYWQTYALKNRNNTLWLLLPENSLKLNNKLQCFFAIINFHYNLNEFQGDMSRKTVHFQRINYKLNLAIKPR